MASFTKSLVSHIVVYIKQYLLYRPVNKGTYTLQRCRSAFPRQQTFDENTVTKTLQEQAYEIIKERLVNCEYEPGSFLNTLALQEQLGFSRTPIREALGRLEKENLVTVVPKKGILVCGIDMNMLNTIYETRMLLEPYIVRTYGGRVAPEALARMRERFSVTPIAPDMKQHFYEYDGEFHSLLNAACPNVYLVQALSQIYTQNRRVRVLSGNVVYRLKDSSLEHIEIIDALLEGDTEKAAKAMEEHLATSKLTAFSLLVKNGV